MKVDTARLASAVGTALLMIATVFPIQAQSLWLDRGHQKAVEFEVFKPFLIGDDIGALSTAYFFSARLPITERALFVGEWPFVYASFQPGPSMGEMTESGIGNPYLGIEIRGGDPRLVGHFGVRLPLLREYHNRLLVGGNSDYTARHEAFSENIVPLTAAVSHQTGFDQGVFVRYFGGINAWVLIGERVRERVEGIGLYSIQLGYVWEWGTVSAGLGGRIILTEPDMDLGKRTAHEAGFNAELGRGVLRPTAFLRVPLGEGHSHILEYSVGIGLRAPLGSGRNTG